ncbi:rhomboid family intramembrane serine protease [Winogradskyella haliclonae]|uniref:Rhomboid family intramembrane serine protease n=1 Tax=Winogradskyella haliclonae TaxID=2048558 RepID=A0ABQ2BZE7_9FLAO|nr:rhomboid family intramembrane serine protease [Winogradskyella haliclonae]GGI57163.1 rhomboid family intramembrane serine protease [Winogradskyella haliclonae]
MIGFRLTDSVKHLLIINILIFVGVQLLGNSYPLYEWFSAFFPLNDNFKLWQPLTHMFMHGDQNHIFSNMLMLFFIGPIVEMGLGSKRFLFLFISAGLGGLLLTYLIDFIQFQMALNDLLNAGFSKVEVFELIKERKYALSWQEVLSQNELKHLVGNYNTTLVGASGSITGILAVLGLMYPNRELQMIFPPIRLKVKYLVVGLIGSDFISALLTGTPLLGQSNIGYVAHVGGAITGALIFWFWKKNSMNKYRWN